MKIIAWFRTLAFVLLAAVLLVACKEEAAVEMAETTLPTMEETTLPETTETEQTEPPDVTYTLSFAGDCTLGCTDEMWYAGLGFIETVGEDYAYPLQNVQCYFASDDLTLVNLEGTLTDSGRSKQEKSYNFRGPTEYINILTLGSVEAVTLANNHSYDYGDQGYESTVKTLEEAGISYVEKNSSTLIAVSDSFTVGIYGASFYLNKNEIVEGIRELKEQGANYIIFAVHWGTENSYTPSATQTSIAHAAIDAGADVVWGSHPHVLQPIEEYEDGIIFYSVGNFCFGGNSCPKDFDSVVIQLTLNCSADGTVKEVGTMVCPVCISSVSNTNNYQPTPYDENSDGYARVMRKLNWSGEKQMQQKKD